MKESDIACADDKELYQAIRAGAESGWDFTARWRRDCCRGYVPPEGELLTYFFKELDTLNILPVDLNALLYRTETLIAEFCGKLAEWQLASEAMADSLRGSEAELQTRGLLTESASKKLAADLKIVEGVFTKLAAARQRAMQTLMFNKDTGLWMDYYLRDGKRSEVVSAAGIAALRCGLNPPPGCKANFPTVLLQGWGLVPTPLTTGQQWDSPNVWPPLLQWAIEYLDRGRGKWSFTKDSTVHSVEDIKDPELKQDALIARRLAQGWVENCSAFWGTNIKEGGLGCYSEKLNTFDYGSPGSGGEYQNQTGFGWSSGLVAELVARFGDELVVRQGQVEGCY